MEARELTYILDAIEKLNTQLTGLTSKIEELAQDKSKKSYDTKDLAAALAKAQGEIPIAALNKTNPYFKSRYADLTSVVSTARPALSKYGLSVTQELTRNEQGQTFLYTRLRHISGQFIESCMAVTPPKNDIQTMSSYITYLKRLSYASLVGVVTGDEDDDAEIAMAENREIMAKGTKLNTHYNPKEQSYETITKEQLEELEYEIGEFYDIAEQILDGLRIQSLADMPKSKYMAAVSRVREIKNLRKGIR